VTHRIPVIFAAKALGQLMPRLTGRLPENARVRGPSCPRHVRMRAVRSCCNYFVGRTERRIWRRHTHDRR
jgi:hypothetical protein